MHNVVFETHPYPGHFGWDIEARFKRFGTAPYRTHVEVLKWMRIDDPPCFLIENGRSEAEKGSTFSFVRTHPL